MSQVIPESTIGGAINLQPIHAAVVTKSDSTTFAQPSTVYVGAAGDVAVRTIGGDTVTFVAMAAGTILPVLCDRVMSTNTSASSMVRMY